MAKTQKPAPSFEETLRHQKQMLERSVLSAAAQGREAGLDDTQDVADQAVASYQKELLFRQGDNGHAQLQLVEQALERLEDGTFGDCVNCGTTINAKRLEALPWTPYCIDCQEKVENGELEMPGRAA